MLFGRAPAAGRKSAVTQPCCDVPTSVTPRHPTYVLALMPICNAPDTNRAQTSQNHPEPDAVKTQFIFILLMVNGDPAFAQTGMVTMMCTTTISTLTLDTMLDDPLIKLVMRSDNVSDEDHSDLLLRVKESLVARAEEAQAVIEAVG